MALIDTSQVVTLEPKSGFVFKTKLLAPTVNPQRAINTKIFVNVCSNGKVPLPDLSTHSFSPETVYPLIMNNQWEIPIIVSSERKDTDNKGQLSLVYDCFINDKCLTWVLLNQDLKKILVEWCMESIELRFSISMDHDLIKYPKLSYKGDLVSLDVLQEDLKGARRQKQDLESYVSKNEHVLMAIDDDDEPDINITPLINTKKPLIEEIQPIKNPAPRPVVSTPLKLQANTSRLSYVLNFKSIQDSIYKLLIYVKPTTPTAPKYNLQYHSKSHCLLLYNSASSKPFEIMLPTYLKPDIVFECFYVKETATLNIFVASEKFIV